MREVNYLPFPHGLLLCLGYSFFLCGGCVEQSRLTEAGHSVQQDENQLVCWTSYPWGGVEVDGLKGFFVEIEKCNNGRLVLPSGGNALRISGACVHFFEKSSYENVIALEWQTWWDYEDCQLKKLGCQEADVVADLMAQLSHFPNLEYLTLIFFSGGKGVVSLPLNELTNLSRLSHLKIMGHGFVVTGLLETLPKMTSLRSLTIEGSPFWDPDPDNEVGSVVLVPTLWGIRETKIEELSLRGCILLSQGDMGNATHVKKFTPPIYYCLRDISQSIEELDMTQSERPLDGYGALTELPNLKHIVIYQDDETAVRQALKGREVEVLVVSDEHIGRGRYSVLPREGLSLPSTKNRHQ